MHALLVLVLIGPKRAQTAAALETGAPTTFVSFTPMVLPDRTPHAARVQVADHAQHPLSQHQDVARATPTPNSTPSTRGSSPDRETATDAGAEQAQASASAPRATQPVCGVGAVIQAALQASAEARLAASGWPQASAVGFVGGSPPSFWDGRWIDGESLGGGDTVEPVRRVITTVLLAASAACLDQLQAGPQSFIISSADDPGGGHAFTLGLEVWRWSDLLQTKAQLASLAPPVGAATP